MSQDGDSSLQWSSQFIVTSPTRTPRNLPGDKITLPQSALEQLLAAAPVEEVSQQNPSSSRPYNNNNNTPFDPFNPYTFATETQARSHLSINRQQQLPHPLTFRLVNPQNGRVVYAGIREFSAEDSHVGLSGYLRHALGIPQDEDGQFGIDSETRFGEVREQAQPQPQAQEPMETEDQDNVMDLPPARTQAVSVTVHAKQLPKGTYVRLRPLEAGYDPEDWKALLERHLRENFTTLTTGELLSVPGGRDRNFRFLVDDVRPEGDGICVVDTDLEVDIEALTEEQARETLRRRLEKASRPPPGTEEGSSIGGFITPGETVSGQVVAGEYVDYELPKWNRGDVVDIELEVADDGDADLLVSPFTSRQRNRPREDEHVFADFSNGSEKQVKLQPTNVELEGAETLYISVHPFRRFEAEEGQTLPPLRYNLRVSTDNPPNAAAEDESPPSHEPDVIQCKNCLQWVPQRTLVLHENFCFRNNALCSQCGKVFQKRSPEWQNHWHCPHDSLYGNDPSSKIKHDTIFHEKRSCPSCAFDSEGFPRLAQHRTSICPGKPILCQFCHLVVPQQDGSDLDMHDPEVILSGLTPHEVVDGARTTECHLCNRIIRLRDMNTHLRHHDLERLSRPMPRICLNKNCGRTVDARGNDFLGLCSICFGPLYVDTYDPEGKSLRRRIERRYLSQMMIGCGKSWCRNDYCKTGRQIKQQQQQQQQSPHRPQSQPSAAEILNRIRPLIDTIRVQPGESGRASAVVARNATPFYFCTDQTSQQRRVLAEMLAAEEGATATTTTAAADGAKTYDLPWCIAAIEAAGGDLDKAREWLSDRVPARGESVIATGI